MSDIYSVWVEVERVTVDEDGNEVEIEASDGLRFGRTAEFGTREEADAFAARLHQIGLVFVEEMV